MTFSMRQHRKKKREILHGKLRDWNDSSWQTTPLTLKTTTRSATTKHRAITATKSHSPTPDPKHPLSTEHTGNHRHRHRLTHAHTHTRIGLGQSCGFQIWGCWRQSPLNIEVILKNSRISHFVCIFKETAVSKRCAWACWRRKLGNNPPHQKK